LRKGASLRWEIGSYEMIETLFAILGYLLVAATGLTGLGALLLFLFRTGVESGSA